MNLYADDSKIISPARTAKEHDLLQADLDKLSDWAKLWRLEFNIKKQRTIHFGRRNVRSLYKLCVIDSVGQMIDSSYAETDLGMLVDKELKFDLHAQ